MKKLIALGLAFALLSAAPVSAAEWTPAADGTWEWHSEYAEEYTGTYYLSSINGLAFDQLGALFEGAGMEELKNTMYLTLNEDGTAVLFSDGDTVPLIWNVAGSDLMLLPQPGVTEFEEVAKGSIGEGIIELSDDEISFTLSKENADTTAFLQNSGQAAPAPVSDGIIPGTYKLYDVMGLSVDQYAALMGATLEEARNSMVMQLNADGSGAFIADGEAEPFAWTTDGSAVTIFDGTDSLAIPLENGILTIDIGGEKISLAKVTG